MVDNSEFNAITVTKKYVKNIQKDFFNQGSAFKPAKIHIQFLFMFAGTGNPQKSEKIFRIFEGF